MNQDKLYSQVHVQVYRLSGLFLNWLILNWLGTFLKWTDNELSVY